MILKIGTITRRKIIAFLLAAVMTFSLLPAGLPAAEDGGATLIPSGDYTISSDGAYRLAEGYSGIITIAPDAYGVTVMGSADGKNHPDTSIKIAERPLPLQLTIEDLKLTAPEGKPGIDFGNAPGVNYEKWPYNLNNAGQPAPYSLANLLRIGGDCSVTGGKGRAGVFVGDEVLLMIDKVTGRTEVQASLTAVGGEQGAGIGGDRGFSGGSVTINDGTITATGGDKGAGLGGLVGTITINGGTVTATGGQDAPGLGNLINIATDVSPVTRKYNLDLETLVRTSSFVIPGETIIINGGTVTADGNNEAGISAMGGLKINQLINGSMMIVDYRKHSLGRLTVNGGSVTARGSGKTNMMPGISGRRIELNAGLVSAFSGNGPGISGVATTINGGTVMASGGSSPNEFQDFINDNLGQLIDMMDSSEDIEIPKEASLDFEALDGMFRSMADMLLGELFGFGGNGGGAGIGLWVTDSLIINDGIVIAQGGPSSAGIGGSVMGGMAGMFAGSMDKDFTPGLITINGGLVSASGGSGGAGIGGGYKQRAEGITISGNPTVIATRGSDGAQDIGAGEGGPETLLRDHLGKALSYIRLEVKDKTTGQPLPDKKVTVDGKFYFSNKDGLLGFFAPRTTRASAGRKGYSAPTKIMVTALASSAFPGAATEIIPSEQNIRAAIDLDFYLQDIALQGISEDNPSGVLLQPVPDFDPQQTSYALDVENTVTSLKVIPEKVAGDPVTAIQVNGRQVKSGEAALVPLQTGENNILITVTLPPEEWAAGAALLKKEYLIKVNRANLSNLPLLVLRESNLPLDEGDTFLARYALELPVLKSTAHVMREASESAVLKDVPGYGGESMPSLSDNTWPGTWTGAWRGTVDYGDGSGLQAIVLREDGSFDLEHRYGMGGDYLVKIVLTYEDSGLVTGGQNVKVNYVAPQLLGADITGEPFDEGGIRVDKNVDTNEGDLLVLEGAVSDPGDNRWVLTVDFHDTLGPLAVPLRKDKTFTLQNTFYDPASVSTGKARFSRPTFHYLDFLVKDNTGLTGARRIKVNVKNVAPSVAAQGASLAQRGIVFSGAGSFSDPGRDLWQGTADYGDGSGPQALALNADKTFSLNHVYMQTGNFIVTVRVEDQDGGVGTASFPVKVKDYVFAIEAGADTSINEGEALIRSVSVRGPATKVQKVTADYGDGSAIENLALGPVNQSGTQNMSETVAAITASAWDIPSAHPQYLPIIGQLNLKHTYADNGKYAVTVKLTDTDGDVYEAGFQAEAANVAPVVGIESGTDYWTMETFTLTGSFNDPGSDTWTGTVDFGDGTGGRELILNDDKTFNVSHSYNSSGSYTITVTVTDDDGGIGQATQRVSVRSRGGGISLDANLYSLDIGAPFAPAFNRNVTEYTVTGAVGATQLTVTAHPQATIRFRVTPNPTFNVIPQETPTSIDITAADLIIEVTAENGDTKTYTVDNTP